MENNDFCAKNVGIALFRVIHESLMNSGKKNVSFDYDAMGNRIAKHVFDDNWMLEKSTYYVLDAQGNQLSMYEHEVDQQGVNYTLTERNIYGSSRLGRNSHQLDLYTADADNPVNSILGEKYYELSNHLGNVLAVINDIKYPVATGTTVDYFEVALVSVSDYSPFGVQLDGRTHQSSSYRYGFGGQEKVDEIKGSGNHYTAEFWEYDPRIGRRWNVDPMSFKYAWQSPYVAFNNNPIRYSDPRGLEGEDEVAPAGHTKSTSATGSNLYLPTGTSTTTFSGSTIKGKTTGNTYNVTEGGVSSFTIGEGDNAKTYNAMFNTKSGEFTGYKTSSGEVYNNPAGLKTEGTVAKVGFGETRGLYPSSDGSKVGANPANWDYQMSQQLMEARAAIEVVSARNTQTHPGATPSTKTAENNQRQFAISENFPAVPSVILNDPNVKYFYLSSSPTSNHAGLSYKYNDITLVKSYGPFYNAGSGGDAKGTAIYINFYSATPKKN